MSENGHSPSRRSENGSVRPGADEHEQFLVGMNHAIARLLSSATISDADILDSLRILGGAVGVERIHIYRHRPGAHDLGYAEQQYEWVSDSSFTLAAQPELRRTPWRGQGIPILERLSNGEPVFMLVSELPDRENSVAGKMGNKSTLLIPVRSQGKLWGHVAFNSLVEPRFWTTAETAALETVASALGSAIDRKHLEQQLASSLAENIQRSRTAEERFSLLTESMKDVLWVYDIGLGRMTYASHAIEAVAGYSPEQAVGMTLSEVVAPHDLAFIEETLRAEHERFLEQGAEKGDYITVEMDLLNHNGSVLPVEAVVRLQRDPFTGRVEAVGAARDITERRKMTEAIRRSEEHYRLLAEHSLDVVVRVSRFGAVEWVSPSLRDALGWEPGDWVGKDVTEYIHHDDVPCLKDTRQRVACGEPTVARFRLRANTGDYRWVEVHAKRYEVVERNQVGAVASFRVVDEEVRTERELERRARRDDLTGALNRREVLDRLESVRHSVVRTGTSSAIMYVDVDNLKEANELHGHCVGDAVLKAVATRMVEVLRANDAVGRIGGDEFLVLLRGVHGADDAVAIGGKVREAVSIPIRTTSGEFITPSVSVGVTMFDAAEDFDQLVVRADEALRSAKQAGRNQVVLL